MPILRDDTFEIQSRNPEQSLRVGQRLGELLTAGDIICLEGGLGAGKTTLARGIGMGWGSTTRLTSPTFTLINIHQRAKDAQKLYHLDAYRLESPQAVDSVGIDDVFEGHGVVLIEWAQRIRATLPPQYLTIQLTPDDLDPDRRLLTISALGDRHLALLNTLRQTIFGV